MRYIPAKEVRRPLRVEMPGMYLEACRLLKNICGKQPSGLDADAMDILELRAVVKLLEIVIYQKEWGYPMMVVDENGGESGNRAVTE